MRTHLYSALATLRFGMDILTGEENVKVEKLYGHGGFFKTPMVGQYMLSAAFNVPVSVTRTAGEGGPYGMALLAAYMLNKKDGESLPDYLDNRVFSGADSVTVSADKADVDGFNVFFERYKKAFETERKAAEVF
jgi:sugar (pentulose or hexulose) kinase